MQDHSVSCLCQINTKPARAAAPQQWAQWCVLVEENQQCGVPCTVLIARIQKCYGLQYRAQWGLVWIKQHTLHTVAGSWLVQQQTVPSLVCYHQAAQRYTRDGSTQVLTDQASKSTERKSADDGHTPWALPIAQRLASPLLTRAAFRNQLRGVLATVASHTVDSAGNQSNSRPSRQTAAVMVLSWCWHAIMVTLAEA